jgi:hypothetical protein
MDRKIPQIPPLRYASVGMTSCGAVIFVRSHQMGWTEETGGPRSTSLRAGSPVRYASVGMTSCGAVTLLGAIKWDDKGEWCFHGELARG